LFLLLLLPFRKSGGKTVNKISIEKALMIRDGVVQTIPKDKFAEVLFAADGPH
jgi:hypothetical protein